MLLLYITKIIETQESLQARAMRHVALCTTASVCMHGNGIGLTIYKVVQKFGSSLL